MQFRRRLALATVLASFSSVVAGSAAHAQTQIKPRVMLMVDTSGSMAEDTVANAATGGDGSSSYQDSQMTAAANQTTPNFSPYPGYSTNNICPPAANTTRGSASKMAAAKLAVTNVINGSGDIDWGLMRYTGASVAFPSSVARNDRSINPDPDISPNRNPFPVICSLDTQCPVGQTCDVVAGSATRGRCTKQRCTSSPQCTVSPAAAGRTCNAATGQCTCGSDAECGGNLRCVTGECRGQGGAVCAANAQCASNACGSNGLCKCNNDNQCLNGCNGQTGECRCNNNNQCPLGTTCDDTTDQCVVAAGAACKSGLRSGGTTQCACTNNNQCPSNLCDLGSGRCLCTANDQCRSNVCRVDTGECGCTSNSQCSGAATCNGATGECEAKANGDCPSGARSGPNNINCTCNGTTAQCLKGQTCTAGACQCATSADCRNGGTCAAGACTSACTTENDCGFGEWCIAGQCGYPNTLTATGNYGETDSRGGTACAGHSGLRVSYGGTCGNVVNTTGGACATEQTCFVDSTCGGATAFTAGQCALIGTGPARSCACATAANCPTDYACSAGGKCVYNLPCSTSGGQILVDPTSVGYLATQILPYADTVEIFTDAGGGVITNPELRANGSTPLGGAARAAVAWYNAIKSAPSGNQLFDPKLACRPYVLVLLTDGVDTCDRSNIAGATNGGNADEGSVAGTQGFVAATASGARFVNRVEVIGLSVNVAADQTRLNNIAIAGASNRTTARFANNQSDIEAALADIVANSVLYEVCNGTDDDCNGLADDGLGVWEECIPGSACMVGTCDPLTTPGGGGRCHCNGTLANQCDPTFVCSNPAGAGFCVPSCTIGQGACTKTGIRKCGGSCCVNDGSAVTACTPIVAGAPGTEVCNNIDDNCNGLVDEGGVCTACQPTTEICNGKDDDCVSGIDNGVLADVGQPCGTDEGECVAGTSACQPTAGTFPNATDRIVCIGGVGPAPEICDGKDNNCDGVVDGMTQACYDGAAATRGVGACQDGQQVCNAVLNSGVSSFGPCVGEILPTAEICNGIDDNCDGLKDNVTGTGGTCCSSGKCGVGVCVAGSLQCSGTSIQCVGEIGPSQEICDNLDNDCNGVTDDVPGKGSACTPATGTCGGHLVCNTTTKTLDCVPDLPMPEICNGIDDDCNGLVDEAPAVTMNDSRLGVACDAPVAPANLPPCMAGKTICQNGTVTCDGAVGPQANVCGQPSRDCATSGIFNGDCPSGFSCFEGNCAAPCGGGEFPCPGGFICKHDATSNMDFCISDACSKLTCPAGQLCQLDANGVASCFNPCDSITCPSGFRCKEGLCIDDSCLTFGCPDGEVCVNAQCKTDPCFGVTCDVNSYCSQDTGTCVRACVGPCPSGEECVDGECTADPCAKTKCIAGQACMVTNGVGMCVADQCAGAGCNLGSACCGGACIQDPCAGVACPGGSACSLTSACNPTCIAETPDKIVGAGGGGFACDVAGGVGARTQVASSPWLLALLGGWLLLRRRRAANS